MRTLVRTTISLVVLAVFATAAPEAAHAYGGPGSVISSIGTFLALVAALVASLFGFVWYPLKRLYKKLSADEEDASEATPAGQ
jgi:hypothetical protein